MRLETGGNGSEMAITGLNTSIQTSQVKTFGNYTYEIIPAPLWETVLDKAVLLLAVSLFVFAVNLALNAFVLFVCGKAWGLVMDRDAKKRHRDAMKAAVKARMDKKESGLETRSGGGGASWFGNLAIYALVSLFLEGIACYVIMFAAPYYPVVSETIVAVVCAAIIYCSFMNTVGKRMEDRDLAVMAAWVLMVCTNPVIGFVFIPLEFIGASGLVNGIVATVGTRAVTVVMSSSNASLDVGWR